MAPVFHSVLPNVCLQDLTHADNHQLTVMWSPAPSLEGPDSEAPDEPLIVHLSSQYLGAIWDGVVERVSQPGFEEFAGASLVVLYKGSPCGERSHKQAWSEGCTMWDMGIDMTYVPIETMDVQMASYMKVRPSKNGGA